MATYPLEAARARGWGVLEPVEVHSIVPALIVHAGILMPRHVYVPVLVQPLPALCTIQTALGNLFLYSQTAARQQ